MSKVGRILMRGFVVSLLVHPVRSAETHWSLEPLVRPDLPAVAATDWALSPVDLFVLRKLEAKGLKPAKPASRETLIRRLYVDLLGLIPSPEEIHRFKNDPAPDAYSRLVDDLLDRPQYGERWARRWMDLVRYAETHGHDEDVIRENAWPYRDYLIRAFNRDIPYSRFVSDQIAGDVLRPKDPDSIVATGFLSCGPWDESSQMGIQDGTLDKKVAQLLDRDDMITATFSTFASSTVHCARCHDHKFDPISIEDYYALQAVFAGVDRVDRPYPVSRKIAEERERLETEWGELERGILNAEIEPDARRRWEADWLQAAAAWRVWRPTSIDAQSELTSLDDGSYLGEGDLPDTDTYTLSFTRQEGWMRSIRLEALTHASLSQGGPGRQANGNLHLNEFRVSLDGEILEIERARADFNQSGWSVDMAIDGDPKTAWGIYPEVGKSHAAVFELRAPIEIERNQVLRIELVQTHGGGHVIGRFRVSVSGDAHAPIKESLAPDLLAILQKAEAERGPEERLRVGIEYQKRQNIAARKRLPSRPMFYGVASDFEAKGNFKPAGGPRTVHVLRRGNIQSPDAEAIPGTIDVFGLPARFESKDERDEGARRAALARWMTHRDNGLVWRSIVNRVWQSHFGRGIVDTPNDFGRMGAEPSHRDALDWLAVDFRDRGGSFKTLHRLILNSATYRQRSEGHPATVTRASNVDAENRLLWRMNPARMEAEVIRDATLALSGQLDFKMYGPSARQFHTSPGVHLTPVVDYRSFDPDAPENRRRAVYRFIFRTLPDPLMAALGCPDASQLAPKRASGSTPLQALAMLNNEFLVRQSEWIATRLQSERDGVESQIRRLFQLAYGRAPSSAELADVVDYTRAHGLANACRAIINTNEFIYVP